MLNRASSSTDCSCRICSLVTRDVLHAVLMFSDEALSAQLQSVALLAMLIPRSTLDTSSHNRPDDLQKTLLVHFVHD